MKLIHKQAHTHPAETNAECVEKVILQSGVKAGDEGCKEHYDVRVVSADPTLPEPTSAGISPADARRALILGEVLATPRFRYPYRFFKENKR